MLNLQSNKFEHEFRRDAKDILTGNLRELPICGIDSLGYPLYVVS